MAGKRIAKEIITKDFHASFLQVRDALLGRTVDLDRKHYVIVPDKCSLYAERFMFEGTAGAFDAEVLTFDRLYLKFARGNADFLPKSGAIMLLRKIIDEVKKDFRVFKNSAGFSGFAVKMYETIRNIQNAGLSPDDLAVSAGAAGLKLADIKSVYERYLRETGGRFVDTPGQMRLLIRDLASADISRAHFYIAGFDRFTQLEEEVLELLTRRAASVTRYTAQEPSYVFGTVEWYEAGERAERTIAAAKRIREAVLNGARYSDCCVLAPASFYAPLSRILTEFGIPCHIDKKLNLRDTELFRFLALSDVCAGAYRRADMIALAKNRYTGIDKPSADAFENYVLANNVNYKGFCEPFDAGAPASADTDYAEQVRQQLLGYLTQFAFSRAAIKTPRDFCVFLQRLLDRVSAAETTAALSAAFGADLQQVYGKICETAEFLLSAAPATGSAATFFTLFSEGVSAVELSLLPLKADVVSVGGAETFRAGRFRLVCAVDFCEGSVPELSPSGGLISDADAAALAQTGIAVGATEADGIRFALNETVRVLASADALFLAYSDAADDRISSLAPRVTQGAQSVTRSSAAAERAALYAADSYRDAVKKQDKRYLAFLGREASAPNNALEMLICGLSEARAQKPSFPFLKDLRAAVGDGADAYINAAAPPAALLPEAGALFFRAGTVSVSGIQTYFDCPYKSFASSSLRLGERDTGEIMPVDVGTFLHRAAERFIQAADFSDPPAVMSAIVSALFRNEYASLLKKNALFAARMATEACRLSDGLARSLTDGDFQNYGVEMRFGNAGERGGLATLSFDAGGRPVVLHGMIDRVDVYKSGENDVYARVIDYKTGRKPTFSYRELYYGRRIQLAVYLKILERNSFSPAGMFYFPLSARWNDGECAHRLIGAYNDAEELILAADRNLREPGASGTVIAASRKKTAEKTGEYRLKKSAYACDSETLSRLGEYAVRVLNGALQEIAGGYIAPAPHETACAYCGYGAMCGFVPKTGRVRAYGKITRGQIETAAGEST